MAKKRYSIYVDDRVLKKLKEISERKEIPFNQVLTQALQQFVNRETLPEKMGV